MSDQSSHQGPGPSRKFLPDATPLESRLLLSRQVSFPDGTSFSFPTFPRLPRTGGVSEQSGTVLGIGVGQSSGNTAQVTDDSKGDIQAEWNGGPVHSFNGIHAAVIRAQRARTDQFTFHLQSGGDTFTATAEVARSTFQQPGPSTGSTGIELGSHGPTDSVAEHANRHPRDLARVARTSGSAVQSGSVLTVTVDKRTTNTVEISNSGGGAVAVEWNGGAVHSFTDVATIVVDTQNARNDLVALDDATH